MIPPKREILVMIPMATLQQRYYEAIVDKSIARILDRSKAVGREAVPLSEIR